jgi:hypothetical protein
MPAPPWYSIKEIANFKMAPGVFAVWRRVSHAQNAPENPGYRLFLRSGAMIPALCGWDSRLHTCRDGSGTKHFKTAAEPR